MLLGRSSSGQGSARTRRNYLGWRCPATGHPIFGRPLHRTRTRVLSGRSLVAATFHQGPVMNFKRYTLPLVVALFACTPQPSVNPLGEGDTGSDADASTA